MKKLLVAGLVLIAIGVMLWPEQPTQPVVHPAAPETLRQTTAGPVVGFVDELNTHGWTGIPFAAPPIGDLRWAAPRLPEPWQEPLQAVTFNNACLQLWGILAGTDGELGQVVGSEDCLYLNVWAPAGSSDLDSEPLPVMFWIHGGGNTIGTANTSNGARLAAEQNLVVVTINYRLGVLGWLSHPALRQAERSAHDASGNYGTLDMIAALQWVQYNIASFGGDPDNVTIFGESAGGRNVYSLMFSPPAAGLFHQVIAQSGTPGTTPRWQAENYTDDDKPGHSLSSREWLAIQLQQAGKVTDRDAAKASQLLMSDAETLEFMHSRSSTELLAGIEGMMGMYPAPQVIRDGVVIPESHPYALLEDTAHYNSVPLMTGTTKDEAKLFMAQSPEFVEMRLGLFPRIINLDDYNRAAAYATDPWKAMAVDEPAEIIVNNSGKPVYAYRWDWDEGAQSWMADFANLLGAGHGLEVSWIFNDFDRTELVPGLYTEENIPGRDKLARQMRNYWGEFAHSGSPGRGTAKDQVEWAAWTSNGDNLMLLDTDAGGGLRMVNEPMTAALLKQRIAGDTALAQELRCALYAGNFLQRSPGDNFWDEAEYRELGCEDYDPWRLQIR